MCDKPDMAADLVTAQSSYADIFDFCFSLFELVSRELLAADIPSVNLPVVEQITRHLSITPLSFSVFHLFYFS